MKPLLNFAVVTWLLVISGSMGLSVVLVKASQPNDATEIAAVPADATQPAEATAERWDEVDSPASALVPSVGRPPARTCDINSFVGSRQLIRNRNDTFTSFHRFMSSRLVPTRGFHWTGDAATNPSFTAEFSNWSLVQSCSGLWMIPHRFFSGEDWDSMGIRMVSNLSQFVQSVDAQGSFAAGDMDELKRHLDRVQQMSDPVDDLFKPTNERIRTEWKLVRCEFIPTSGTPPHRTGSLRAWSAASLDSFETRAMKRIQADSGEGCYFSETEDEIRIVGGISPGNGFVRGISYQFVRVVE